MTAHRWIMGGRDRTAGGSSDGSCKLGGTRWPIIISNLIFRAGNLGIVGFLCVLGIFRVFQGFYKRKGVYRSDFSKGKGVFCVFEQRDGEG